MPDFRDLDAARIIIQHRMDRHFPEAKITSIDLVDGELVAQVMMPGEIHEVEISGVIEADDE